ncbi:predicted protein [Streptomyces pristinaespiralis ATCC 25486]|uniref:Predicted protein n=1 Tax=Streptomyces pristinaespiralis (strain ATCC 25486 / DSM 40338 / CBS 914.69 / JCM 4507 / KCC S-0507 / NBRC 13074 / NRRL 2958 / 5647) TaxID=457429 RepID=D6X6K5_STRE2|nr:predicted protein [Streptomyces pristinaespiralis ATCC 25486]
MPFAVQAARLVDRVRPRLEEYGDLERVAAFLRRLDEHGCGAQRQRASWSRRSRPADVVDDLVVATAGTGPVSPA